MPKFGPEESYNWWRECISNESLCSLVTDPRVRMVACRDYAVNRSPQINEGTLTLDDLQNYESDILTNLNLK